MVMKISQVSTYILLIYKVGHMETAIIRTNVSINDIME